MSSRYESQAEQGVQPMVTLADLERLQAEVASMATQSAAEVRRLRQVTLVGILMLSLTVLLLHLAR